MSTLASSALPRRAGVNPKPLGVPLLLIVLGAWYLAQAEDARHAAFTGNVFGTRLRPLFGLAVECVKAGGC